MTYITYAQRLGRDEGREEGLRTAFLLQLQASLKAKFGDEGEAILAQLPEQTPIARLQELALQVAVATTIDSLRPQFSQS